MAAQAQRAVQGPRLSRPGVAGWHSNICEYVLSMVLKTDQLMILVDLSAEYKVRPSGRTPFTLLLCFPLYLQQHA